MVTMLRHAHTDAAGHGRYLNVLREHVSSPVHPGPLAHEAGFLERAEAFLETIIKADIEAEIAKSAVTARTAHLIGN